MRWSRPLGDIDAAATYGSSARQSLYVGNTDGAIYRVQTTDGQSRWSSGGSGCGAFAGDEQVYCTATDTRTNASSCPAGPAVTSGFFVVWTGTHAGRIVFAAADGYVRMIDPTGQLVWKSPAPISGASFPLLLPQLDSVFVSSTAGKVRQLSLSTGVQTAVQQVGDGTGAVGSLAYDTYAQQLYVACTDGKLYRYAVPF